MDLWSQIVPLLPEMRAFAGSIVTDAAEADDLVHDAVERAVKADCPPDAPEQLRPWLFRIIRNLNIDELRKRRVRTEYSWAHSRFYGENPSFTAVTETTVLIRTAFERLTSAEREILCLVDVLGMKYAEAASVLDVPQGTVMSRISRARRSLLALIEPADHGPSVEKLDKKRL